MTEPAVLPIASSPMYGGDIEWGQAPPQDRADKREMFTTKNPETGGTCIWNWDHMAWFEITAVRVGKTDRLRRENEDLKRQVAHLEAQVVHWKANHRERCDAARVLIERLDMPLERVGAYRQYLAALNRAAHLEEQLDAERRRRVVGPIMDQLKEAQ
jgi:hypothetical protein